MFLVYHIKNWNEHINKLYLGKNQITLCKRVCPIQVASLAGKNTEVTQVTKENTCFNIVIPCFPRECVLQSIIWINTSFLFVLVKWSCQMMTIFLQIINPKETNGNVIKGGKISLEQQKNNFPFHLKAKQMWFLPASICMSSFSIKGKRYFVQFP